MRQARRKAVQPLQAGVVLQQVGSRAIDGALM
jgi:hypothetical protein